MSAGISSILETFSQNQLRDLEHSLAAHGVSLPPSAGREALISTLESRASDRRLRVYAHRIEAVTPYKHLYVYTLQDEFRSFASLKTAIEGTFPELIHDVRHFEPKSPELQPQLCLLDPVQQRVYVKLVHQVETSHWERVSPTEKRLKKFKKRHPVVLTFRPEEGVTTVAFPGYTGAASHIGEERITYAGIASEAIRFAEAALGIRGEVFQAKPAIELLLKEDPSEVTQIRRIVTPSKGRRFAFDAGENETVEAVVADWLRTSTNVEVTAGQVMEALRRSAASDIVLLWKKLNVVTRVGFTDEGPEIYFIWRGTGAASTLVDTVVRKIVSYHGLLAKPEAAKVRRAILSTGFGVVLKPSALSQEYGISSRAIVDILNEAVANGNFEPRFRVNTHALLQDVQNEWRSDPQGFPRTVMDEHNNKIDLTNPSNIEVGFERVK